MKSVCDFRSENLRSGTFHVVLLPKRSPPLLLPHHMTFCAAQPAPATYIRVTYWFIMKIKK